MKKFIAFLLFLFAFSASADVTIPSGTRSILSNDNYNRFNIYKVRSLYLADSSAHTMLIAAPSSLSNDSVQFIFPSSNGSANQCLASDGAGSTSWQSVLTPGTGSIVNADISPTAAIARSKLASGSATEVVVNNGAGVMTSIGPLTLTYGGLGITSGNSGGLPYFSGNTTIASTNVLTQNGVLLGGGSGQGPSVTSAGSAYQPLRIPSGGGAADFGALDVSQSAAVTGILAASNGGTGQNSSATFPASGVIVTEDATEILTNKTLSGNIAASLLSGSGTLTLNTTGTITVPSATDTLVGKATVDTLTNKILSGNTATNLVSGSGTLILNTTGTATVPNATDTLVGKATTDTLTNKSISGSTNTLTNIPLTSVTGVLGTTSGGTGQNSSATFPTSGVVVTEAATETLTNKTLSGNTATNLISGTGTLTLNTTGTVTVPSTTDTLVGKATTDTLTNKTLSGNTATNLVSGSGTLTLNTTGTITVPSATDTLVGKATIDTLTNKTISGASNTITNVSLTAGVTGILPTANGGTNQNSTATFPASGVVVTEAATETLTNKTLNGNTATNLVSGSGTLTLNTTGTITVPNATDTLVGKATTDTLTNKTISGASNTITNVSLTTGVTGILPTANGGTNQNSTATFPASGVVVTEAATETLTNKTLNGNTATNLVSGSGTLTLNTTGTITVPSATDTLVGKATTDTLTNKTLSGNTATNLISGSGTLTLNTTGTATVPNATDTLVGKATTDTLTNKTLTGNTAVNLVSGSGTLTLNTTGTATVPNATDTLVGKATTDTLTNKTLTSDHVTTNLLWNGTSSGTMTMAPGAAITDYTITWPTTQGAASTVLTNNGSGALSWGAGLTTSLTSAHLFVGNASNIATDTAVTGDVTISNAGVTAIGSGVVTSTMIADGTIVNADINASAAIDGSKLVAASASVAGAVSTVTQTFSGRKHAGNSKVRVIVPANQSIAASTVTRINFNSEDFDTNNEYAGTSVATCTGSTSGSSTTLTCTGITGTISAGDAISGTGVSANTTVVTVSGGTVTMNQANTISSTTITFTEYRFTPTVSGYYHICAAGRIDVSTQKDVRLSIAKNGSASARQNITNGSSGADATQPMVCDLENFNGSTDYVIFFVENGDATTKTLSSATNDTWMEIYEEP